MSDNFQGMERRITIRLLAYWERLRGKRDMPTEEDIDPDDLQDLWDNCFLIHVKDLSKPDYNYTYLGTAIIEAYRSGLSESDPGRLISPNADKLAHSYSEIVKTGKPVIEEDEFRNLHNDIVKYRQCLLPLGHNGTVDAIFGGMRFKIFPSE